MVDQVLCDISIEEDIKGAAIISALSTQFKYNIEQIYIICQDQRNSLRGWAA
jgi:hypothetical protein